MRIRAAAGVALLAILLASCAAQNVGTEFKLAPDRKTGLLMASATVSGDVPHNLQVTFHPQGKERGVTTDFPVILADEQMDWPVQRRPTRPPESPAGRLMALEVPAGDYEFFWFEAGMGTIRLFPSSAQLFRFTIAPGKATYVGNVHLHFEGRRYIFRAFDQQQRDVPLLRSKYPNITDDQFEIRLIKVRS